MNTIKISFKSNADELFGTFQIFNDEFSVIAKGTFQANNIPNDKDLISLKLANSLYPESHWVRFNEWKRPIKKEIEHFILRQYQ
ncbi:hypothetical protein J3L18_13700 [Mucilaginibacter gossypii]|uniref:hypothetical protein n=1 Tax=Mucilaginibacter gossypii TaxID=551996 RepID=UPI000DCB25BA|nr:MULTISPECIES: hypothetical protein [Mucilaginibacter]QTE40056.1 hypothetical protein J3L18_13700 [Mucilaginibacter gossypii]RAV50908.1 hypothetical protein DIU36_26230 [Mucilaginibacter rubeus]